MASNYINTTNPLGQVPTTKLDEYPVQHFYHYSLLTQTLDIEKERQQAKAMSVTFSCGTKGQVNASSILDVTDVYNCGVEAALSNASAYTFSNQAGSSYTRSKHSLVFYALISFIVSSYFSTLGLADNTPSMELSLETIDGVLDQGDISGSDIIRVSDDTVIFDIETFDSANTTGKRDYVYDSSSAGSGIRYKQAKRVQDGTWWTGWEKASGCLGTQFGDSGSVTTSASITRGWSISVSGGISWGVVSATSTYTISEEFTYSISWSCNVPAGSVGRIFMQNKMYWADYQYQTCYRNVPGACGSSNFCCGAYSPYIRVNAPISDNHLDNRNVGCSIGSAAEC